MTPINPPRVYDECLPLNGMPKRIDQKHASHTSLAEGATVIDVTTTMNVRAEKQLTHREQTPWSLYLSQI